MTVSLLVDITFCFLLESPMPFKDKSRYPLVYETGDSNGVFVYDLQIHQSRSQSYPRFFERQSIITSFVNNAVGKKALPEHFYDTELSDELCESIVTVTVTAPTNCESIETVALRLFDFASEFLFDFAKSSHLLKFYPFESTTNCINPVVTYFWRYADSNFDFEVDSFIIQNSNLRLRDHSADFELNYNDWKGAYNRYKAHDPTVRYVEYRERGNRDAASGSYSQACLNYGIAAEVILSAALGMMIWDEMKNSDLSEEAAYEIIVKPGFSSQMKNEFHPRLGGNWGNIRNEWEKNIYTPRNSVVHAAAVMSESDAERSKETLLKIQTYLADRLVEKSNIYPFAALAIAGKVGFDSRNRHTRFNSLKIDSEEIMNNLKEYAQWSENLYKLDPTKFKSQYESKSLKAVKRIANNLLDKGVNLDFSSVDDFIASLQAVREEMLKYPDDKDTK